MKAAKRCPRTRTFNEFPAPICQGSICRGLQNTTNACICLDAFLLCTLHSPKTTTPFPCCPANLLGGTYIDSFPAALLCTLALSGSPPQSSNQPMRRQAQNIMPGSFITKGLLVRNSAAATAAASATAPRWARRPGVVVAAQTLAVAAAAAWGTRASGPRAGA